MKRNPFLFVTGIFVTAGLAFVLPIILGNQDEPISDEELEAFRKESFSLAEEQLSSAKDQFFILSYKVDEITLHEGEPVAATVTAYTFFGIPYAIVDTDQESAGVRLR